MGKTTLLSAFRMGHPVLVEKTTSFECHALPGWTAMDLGGNERNRQLWHYFYPNTDAILWVMSSQGDPDDLNDLYDILEKNRVLDDVPLIVVLNQFKERMDTQEVIARLRNRPTRVLSMDVRRDFQRIQQYLDWAKKESKA